MNRSSRSQPRRLLRAPLLALFTMLTMLLVEATATGAVALAPRQCAMCKDYVYSQDNHAQGDRTSRAVYHSILGMLGVPLVLAAGLVTLIVLNNRARMRMVADAVDGPGPPAALRSNGN